MATIYRFIVEQKISSTGDGRKSSSGTGKGASKKGRAVSIFGGSKGTMTAISQASDMLLIPLPTAKLQPSCSQNLMHRGGELHE